MIVTRQQTQLHHIASKDDARFDLQFLRITPEGVVTATDGTILCEVASRNLPKEEEIPQVEGQKGAEPEGTVHLHAAPAVHAGRIMPTDPEQPGYGLARLLVQADGTLTLGAVDGATPQLVMHAQPDRLRYPATGTLFPAGEPEAQLMVSAKLLKKVCEVALRFGLNANKPLRLSIYGPRQPILFEFEDDRHVARGLLMPIVDAADVAEAKARPFAPPPDLPAGEEPPRG